MKNELRDVLELLQADIDTMRDVYLTREQREAFDRIVAAAPSAEPDSDGERLSDAACDAIARALDAHGRDKLGYGGGLPAWDEECFIVMRHLIRDAARSAAQEK